LPTVHEVAEAAFFFPRSAEDGGQHGSLADKAHSCGKVLLQSIAKTNAILDDPILERERKGSMFRLC